MLLSLVVIEEDEFFLFHKKADKRAIGQIFCLSESSIDMGKKSKRATGVPAASQANNNFNVF